MPTCWVDSSRVPWCRTSSLRTPSRMIQRRDCYAQSPCYTVALRSQHRAPRCVASCISKASCVCERDMYISPSLPLPRVSSCHQLFHIVRHAGTWSLSAVRSHQDVVIAHYSGPRVKPWKAGLSRCDLACACSTGPLHAGSRTHHENQSSRAGLMCRICVHCLRRGLAHVTLKQHL